MDLNIKGTPVLQKLLDTNKRFVLSIGSSRSSKTWSMFQWIVIYCAENKNKEKYISVVRQSFPSLRKSAYREFIIYLNQINIYSVKNHNKTENKINVFGNWVEFFSADDEQKVRGSKRDILYINEVNEINYDAAQQLFLRTTDRVFMDMNPSDIYHWSYKMKDRNDVDYIHSTYKDNTFLSKENVQQIESYKDTDENYWRVFGLGLPGSSLSTIYTHYKIVKEKDIIYKDFNYGLDVGYNHKMALVKNYFNDDIVYSEQIIYQSGLTTNTLIELMLELNIDKYITIWVDAAAPMMIDELNMAGFTAKPAKKSVKEGIDLIRSKKWFILNESTDLIEELKRYSWKVKNEEIIYEPVKVFDDLVDAARYGIFNHYITNSVEDWNLLF